MFKNSTTEERRLRREAKARAIIKTIRTIKWRTGKVSVRDRISAKERRARLLNRKETQPDHLVYFVYCAGRIKIGQTSNGYRRAGGLTNGTPLQPWTIYCRPGGKITEYAFHCRFEADRLHGEWFEFSNSIREFVLEYGGKSAAIALREAEQEHSLWVADEAKKLGIVTIGLPNGQETLYTQHSDCDAGF